MEDQQLTQKTVDFYGDEIPVVTTEENGRNVVYVPLRPICDFLGINWSAQSQRIKRDPILDEISEGVVVTHTRSTARSGGGAQTMTCIPLDYLNGWLFGINANRVAPEIRERVLTYQRDCYRVLAEAFGNTSAAATSPNSALIQVREMGRAIMQMAQEQIEFDGRLALAESQLTDTSETVGDLTKRLTLVETQLHTGEPVSDQQASQLSQSVKAIAIVLSKQTGRNEFGAVYGELYRRFNTTSYKTLPAAQFLAAMKWLREFYEQVAGTEAEF